MNKSYVKIDRTFSPRIVWGNNGKEYSKDLIEFTSWVSAHHTEEEKIKSKQKFCDTVSQHIDKPFTINDLDKIITKQDYKDGSIALAEFTHIVNKNIKNYEQGKEPAYLATSLEGSLIIKHILEIK